MTSDSYGSQAEHLIYQKMGSKRAVPKSGFDYNECLLCYNLTGDETCSKVTLILQVTILS